MTFPDNVRQVVMRRDGHQCCSCQSRDDLQLDHVIPQSFTQGPSNAQVLCGPCNKEKGDRYPTADEQREVMERQAAYVAEAAEAWTSQYQALVMSNPLVDHGIKVWRAVAYERDVSDELPKRFAEVIYRLATDNGLTKDVLTGAIERTLAGPRDSQIAYLRTVVSNEMDKRRKAS